jgi:putative endonuclease
MNQNWVFYILRCKDNSLYSGITTNLGKRLAEHNSSKGAKYTASRLPVILVHSENCRDASEARRREALIKSWPKSKKEQLVAGSSNNLTNKNNV